MKKLTYTLVAILALGFTANAQTPDVKFGAKTGLNVSNLSGAEDASSRTSFHVGAVAEIFFTEKFSVQPEVLYSAQGYKVSDNVLHNGAPVEIKETARMDYINIPVMAKYYLVNGLNVQVGPQFGFLATAKTKVNESNGANIPEVDFKDNVKSFDFGINFGAGYELPMGVFFDARYNLGITKVNKEGDKSLRNGVFQLSVGYKF
ncbi:porin family protein [Myroides pelagicus]|uniref:Outer membrane beta-barrel protein n=1 Tax=Myroides pelagicus TaxID=270914 RepID=A0A7K1GQD3_9FLAO|nr:porin family protein [Myroides pelagicus]MTH30593.1 outer membrane beta-barrel protein [Myroides pelagicus]